MKILVDNTFYKTVPKEKKDIVEKRLNDFVISLKTNNYDLRKIQNSFSVREIRASHGIRKFRMDGGDRILFTFLSKHKDGAVEKGFRREDLADDANLLILEYCKHDSAIVHGKRRQITAGRVTELELPDNAAEEDEERLFDESVRSKYPKDYQYVADRCIVQRIYEDDLPRLLELKPEEILYYLNDEQHEVLSKPLPVLLFGCAGSGKTTITVRKLLTMSQEALAGGEKPLIGYFTYSEQLETEVKKCAEYLFEKEGMAENLKQVEFWPVRRFLEDKNSREFSLRYRRFADWYQKRITRQHYDIFAVWREIRGIIKGSIRRSNDSDWGEEQQGEAMPKLMSEEVYASLGNRYSVFDQADKEKLYEIARAYQRWLDENNEVDDNDLATALLNSFHWEALAKYDYIIIDEIQDLTEKEILLLLHLVKNSNHVFWSGDVNQTVNATYFEPHRLTSLFWENQFNFKRDDIAILKLNYRCAGPIVQLANAVVKLRTNTLHKDKFDKMFDYEDGAIKASNDSDRPQILRIPEAATWEVLKTADQRAYATIVVNDEDGKEKLKEKGIENVFTVAEIKGIEKPYIVCYNLISDNSGVWENIVNDEVSQNSLYRYRYFFNSFYVAITRARKYLCFVEDSGGSLYDKVLAEYMDDVSTFYDEQILHLEKVSSEADYEKEGKRLEENRAYPQAKIYYQRAGNERAVKRCECMMEHESGNFAQAASGFFGIGEYDWALDCYRKANNIVGIIKSQFMLKKPYSEILGNLGGDEKRLERLIMAQHDEDLLYLYKKNKIMQSGSYAEVLAIFKNDERQLKQIVFSHAEGDLIGYYLKVYNVYLDGLLDRKISRIPVSFQKSCEMIQRTIRNNK